MSENTRLTSFQQDVVLGLLDAELTRLRAEGAELMSRTGLQSGVAVMWRGHVIDRKLGFTIETIEALKAEWGR